MMTPTPERRLLGRFTTMSGREAIWETPEGLEIETRDQYEVLRKAVLFEDVLMVTYHRQLGAMFFILQSVAIGFFLAMMGVLMSMNESVAGGIFGLLAVPFAVAMAVRAILKVDVVTVFGRRSRARMQFSFRKQRARQLYGSLCSRVRQVQRQIEQEIAAEAAKATPIAEEPPLPPIEANPFASPNSESP